MEAFLKKNSGKTIVFTNGCFDLLHPGHIQYLNDAKSLGDLLVIGLNSDASVKRLKGSKRPLNNESDRKFMLENLKSVDWVELFEEDTPLNLIMKVNPQILVKGGDYSPTEIVGYDFVKKNNGRIKCLSFLDGYSTTQMISAIKNS